MSSETKDKYRLNIRIIRHSIVLIITLIPCLVLSFQPPRIEGDVNIQTTKQDIRLCFTPKVERILYIFAKRDYTVRELSISTEGEEYFYAIDGAWSPSQRETYCFTIGSNYIELDNEKRWEYSLHRFFMTNIEYRFRIRTNYGNYYGVFTLIDENERDKKKIIRSMENIKVINVESRLRPY